MAAAGAEAVDVHRVLAKTGDNLVGELLKNNGTFYEWDHYPPGDVYDHETHGQYYYHAHAADQRFDGEHGHFHTFVRSEEHTSELQSLMRISYAVFCLKKKKKKQQDQKHINNKQEIQQREAQHKISRHQTE